MSLYHFTSIYHNTSGYDHKLMYYNTKVDQLPNANQYILSAVLGVVFKLSHATDASYFGSCKWMLCFLRGFVTVRRHGFLGE